MNSPEEAGLDHEIELFITDLRARLYAGKRAYGDLSFTRRDADLLDERAQEALDAAGWSFILWSKFRKVAP